MMLAKLSLAAICGLAFGSILGQASAQVPSGMIADYVACARDGQCSGRDRADPSTNAVSEETEVNGLPCLAYVEEPGKFEFSFNADLSRGMTRAAPNRIVSYYNNNEIGYYALISGPSGAAQTEYLGGVAYTTGWIEACVNNISHEDDRFDYPADATGTFGRINVNRRKDGRVAFRFLKVSSSGTEEIARYVYDLVGPYPPATGRVETLIRPGSSLPRPDLMAPPIPSGWSSTPQRRVRGTKMTQSISLEGLCGMVEEGMVEDTGGVC